MSFKPTRDQREALDRILAWFSEGGKTLTLGGYAGTGKTTLLGQVRRRLPHIRMVYASYTGKAVQVLRTKLPPGTEISTLHRLLYTPTHRVVCKVSGEDLSLPANLGQHRPGSMAQRAYCDKHKPTGTARPTEDGDLIDVPLPKPCTAVRKLDWLQNLSPLEGIDLVVVDEASMVSDKIWADLTKWNVPVLAVGDHGQLPPIKSSFNLMADPEIRLEEIVRQVADSPIIKMSMRARAGEFIRFGDYGDGVQKIHRAKLGRMEMDPDSPDEMIIVGFNRTRNDTNEMIRRQLGRKGDPTTGDIVICLRNDYERGVFNGNRGRLEHFDPTNPFMPWAEITIFGEDFTYEGGVSLEQFGQPKTMTDQSRKLGLWDFGYAITCHKAQGSQADRVTVIEERMPSADDEYHARWLYTAVTRAVSSLVLVGG